MYVNNLKITKLQGFQWRALLILDKWDKYTPVLSCILILEWTPRLIKNTFAYCPLLDWWFEKKWVRKRFFYAKRIVVACSFIKISKLILLQFPHLMFETLKYVSMTMRTNTCLFCNTSFYKIWKNIWGMEFVRHISVWRFQDILSNLYSESPCRKIVQINEI